MSHITARLKLIVRGRIVLSAVLITLIMPVTVALDKNHSFRIYVSGEKLGYGPHLTEKVQKIKTEKKPLITEEDVIKYYWNSHTLVISERAASGLPKPGVYGIPFVVEADDVRCYAGAFWTDISSVSFFNPVIVLPPFGRSDRIKIDPWYTQPVSPQRDLRNDMRIYNSLKALGKLAE